MSQSHRIDPRTPQTPVPPDALGESIGTATYSPEDNKLRLYPLVRLDPETYERVKAAGFTWAAKQELFVAPAWSPERVDLLVELCGELEDEGTSLAERADQRAARFTGYRERRTGDAVAARTVVERITSGIPLGQPILVGHHSERHARRDAERIENGMRKAVKMWETANYWRSRAAGVISHADYKDRADVRARRIKTIEAEQRKCQRNLERAETWLRLWGKLDDPRKDGSPATHEVRRNRALFIANHAHVSRCFSLAEYPRPEGATSYEGPMGLWSALNDGIVTVEQARDIAIAEHERCVAINRRWIEHTEHRIAYERALLEAQGAAELLDRKPRREGKAALPLLNYRAPDGVLCRNIYYPDRDDLYPQVEMTAAEYAKIPKDYKATRESGNSHRVRTAMRNVGGGRFTGSSLVSVFLTDSKTHERPADAPKPAPREIPLGLRTPRRAPTEPSEDAQSFAAMKGALAHGVQVVTAASLFPTPEPLAKRMAELAKIQRGARVLEPSAGTGQLVEAARTAGGVTTAVEIDVRLCSRLRLLFDDVREGDFLEVAGELGTFDAVIMNPPFERAADIEHIVRAWDCVRPGGRLVAICAAGPRQQARLRPWVESHGGTWEPLPPDTFKAVGTGVCTVLLVVTKPSADASRS